MQKLYMKFKGRTAILQNNPKETLGRVEEEPTKGRVKQPPPDEQAKMRRYLLPDGNFYVPATAVRKCLLTASSGYTAKGEVGRRTAVRPILSGALILSDPAFPLLDDNDEPIPGDQYEVDIQRVTIRAARASVWRGRPRIWPWNLLCWFNFDPRRLDFGLVERIAKDAGVYPGLLDFRPEKGGWFGTFEVVKVWTEEMEYATVEALAKL
jgi:hypothetical protein